jgi:hypothetical protein
MLRAVAGEHCSLFPLAPLPDLPLLDVLRILEVTPPTSLQAMMKTTNVMLVATGTCLALQLASRSRSPAVLRQ